MRLNEAKVNYSRVQWDYLEKTKWERVLTEQLGRSQEVESTTQLLEEMKLSVGPYVMYYDNQTHFQKISNRLGVMGDFKAGHPRCSYHGVVHFYYNENLVYLAPSAGREEGMCLIHQWNKTSFEDDEVNTEEEEEEEEEEEVEGNEGKMSHVSISSAEKRKRKEREDKKARKGDEEFTTTRESRRARDINENEGNDREVRRRYQTSSEEESDVSLVENASASSLSGRSKSLLSSQSSSSSPLRQRGDIVRTTKDVDNETRLNGVSGDDNVEKLLQRKLYGSGPLTMEAREKAEAEKIYLEENDGKVPLQFFGNRKVAVVVLCYNRPEYLNRTLKNILQYKPSHIPLFVSQDGDHEGVKELANTVFREDVYYIQNHPRATPPKHFKGNPGYAYISQHYQFVFSRLFDEYGFEKVILLEDDMEIAPDFFDYFDHFGKVLERDTTVYCVSAWNDVGQERFVRDATAFRRTSYFPGLGWMLQRSLWQDELRAKWPTAYWDDWMREDEQRRGRDCIYPEVSRSRKLMNGLSDTQLKLNELSLNFSDISLMNILPRRWNTSLYTIFNTTEYYISFPNVTSVDSENVVIRYTGVDHLKSLLKSFGVDVLIRGSNFPTSYDGAVFFRSSGKLIYLFPANFRVSQISFS
jgi:alpha-1,3-mannosyl-glycoprotein beta-1,2-N-acetylglucosaminyltransferase